MTDFSSLKKSSGINLDRLNKELDKINAPSAKEEDTRFWKIERDKSGNGSAIIRFLPAPEVDGDDALPWVRIFDHGFKGPTGKWYIEKSLTTLGQVDPVSERNSKLWNASSDDNSPERKQARLQKRRLSYISNIMVISDPKHPENEGKVFLFKYGKKIFDKITLLMKPEFEGDAPINPFDLWKGVNLKLRIRTVDGYPNYEQSVFESTPSAISSDDAELEKIWKSEYSLKAFLDPKNFKSYDELKKHLENVIGPELSPSVQRSASSQPKGTALTDNEDVFSSASNRKSASIDDSDEDLDDDLEQFKSLVG